MLTNYINNSHLNASLNVVIFDRISAQERHAAKEGIGTNLYWTPVVNQVPSYCFWCGAEAYRWSIRWELRPGTEGIPFSGSDEVPWDSSGAVLDGCECPAHKRGRRIEPLYK